MLRFPRNPALFVAALVSICPAVADARVHPPYPRGTIQHIVFVIQENRSVDNLFNGFPGADTVRTGKRHDGSTVRLHVTSIDNPIDMDHTRESFRNAYDGGKVDGWDLNGTVPSTPSSHEFAYAYVPESEVRPYWSLAKQYTFADRTFESLGGPSFAAHQYLIAGQSDGVVTNPSLIQQNQFFWGCDAPPTTRVNRIGRDGLSDGPKIFPCFEYRTLADVLTTTRHTWRDYGAARTDIASIWTGYDAIRHIRFGSAWQTNIVTPERKFLSDVRSGVLAEVTWITPDFQASDHAQIGIRQHKLSTMQHDLGPDWVANIVNAVGRSRFWRNTAIVVVWDDWGGWYDHVAPPQLDAMGLGFRVPMIVVGPYAKRGYVSHAQHEFGSLLKFAEEVFSLPSLGTTDERADDLRDCFDFGQRPKSFAPIETAMRLEDFLALAPGGIAPDDD